MWSQESQRPPQASVSSSVHWGATDSQVRGENSSGPLPGLAGAGDAAHSRFSVLSSPSRRGRPWGTGLGKPPVKPRAPAGLSLTARKDPLPPRLPPPPRGPQGGPTCRDQQREDGEHIQGLLATNGHRLACIGPSRAACVTRSSRGGVGGREAPAGRVAHGGGPRRGQGQEFAGSGGPAWRVETRHPISFLE